MAYFAKGHRGGVESQNKQQLSIQLRKKAASPDTFRFSSPACAKWSIFIMSGSKANSIYKRLLHRSLHKSTKAHLMKVCDPSPEIYIQVMTRREAASRCCYLLSFGLSCCRGHSPSQPPHANCINFILQAGDTHCKTTP